MAEFTEFQIREAVAIRAYFDPKFRELLKTDPKAAVEGLLKTQLPDNLKINVVEDTDAQVTFVIPPASMDELTEDQLVAVAGGAGIASGAFSGCIQSALMVTKRHFGGLN